MKATAHRCGVWTKEFPFLAQKLLGGITGEEDERYGGGSLKLALTPNDEMYVGRVSESLLAEVLSESWGNVGNGTCGGQESGWAVLEGIDLVPLDRGGESEFAGCQTSWEAENIGAQLEGIERATGREVTHVVTLWFGAHWERGREQRTLTIYKRKGFDLSAWARRQRHEALAELEAAMEAANVASA